MSLMFVPSTMRGEPLVKGAEQGRNFGRAKEHQDVAIDPVSKDETFIHGEISQAS